MPAPRSALFMPAANQRAIEKARTLPCDAVILDLEDAVAPDRKPDARDAAVAAVQAGFGERAVAIRINALATPWGAADAAAVAGAPIQAVVLPKVDGPDDLAAARTALGADGPSIWAMIESAAGVLALSAIAAAARATRTTMLIAGTNDLAKDLRCRPGPDRAPLLPALAQIVVAARAAEVGVLDGVCNAIDDPDRLAAECAQGSTYGFDGKTLIHPTQIAAANMAFAPSTERVAWAEAVVAAFADPAAAAKGAIRMGGEMIELLHLDEARRVLAMARR